MAKKTENGMHHQRVAGTDSWDVQAVRTNYGQPAQPVQVIIHERLIPDGKARFAMACIERWAIIAGEPDGEDTAGRQRMRRMTPQELTEHACQCAESAFAAFDARGWLAHAPAYPDLIDAIKDQENKND